jgi:hypothetical protein
MVLSLEYAKEENVWNQMMVLAKDFDFLWWRKSVLNLSCFGDLTCNIAIVPVLSGDHCRSFAAISTPLIRFRHRHATDRGRLQHRLDTSNIHCANHRDWFMNYKPFKSHARGVVGGTLDVEGIGDVELRVKKPNRHSKPSYSIIQLKDAVYCPSFLCNVLSTQRIGQAGPYGVKFTDGGGEVLHNGVPIGIIDIPVLMKLRLSGQTPNQTSLTRGGHYVLSMSWSDDERAR